MELSMGLDFRRLNAFANPRLHDMVMIGSFLFPVDAKIKKADSRSRSEILAPDNLTLWEY
jgi:hypothetical protein